MDKYLSNNGFDANEIEYINELLFFYDRHLQYSNAVYRKLLLDKVETESDYFSRKLHALYTKAKKYKPQLLKVTSAHGKRLFAR